MMVNVLLLLQVIIMMSMVSLVITVMVVMVVIMVIMVVVVMVTRALCLSWVCTLPIPLLRTSKLKQPRFSKS